jgi:hypothetical protein
MDAKDHDWSVVFSFQTKRENQKQASPRRDAEKQGIKAGSYALFR